jgi:carotenoid cleavage dioxygenase
VLEGEIPTDLYGGYFRNGPNNAFAPLNRYHWFDGDGMVHGVWFENGTARYSNRWIDTEGLEAEKKKGSPIYPGVLGPFDFTLPGGPLKDTANTDLMTFNGRLLATWYESGRPYAINPETLETIGIETFGGKLDDKISAHSKVDPVTGELIFFSYGDKPPWMQYGVVKPNGDVHHVEIALPGPRRPHDIGVTTNYSILHDFPVFVNEEFFKKTGKRVPLFHKEVPTRYGVIPRFGAGDSIRWFEFEPCYMLHVVNCWEEGDWVTMIGCRTADPSLHPDPKDGEIAAMLSFLKLQANLYEWKMNIVTGETSERTLDDLNAEFPKIAASAIGTKNRFSYHQYIPYEIPATFDALVKYDLQTGNHTRWEYGKGIFGSEAPFAPRQGSVGEDDGYIVTITTDTNDWTSACEIFDASQIEAGPVAKVALPHRVPAGFHATWMPGEHIAK